MTSVNFNKVCTCAKVCWRSAHPAGLPAGWQIQRGCNTLHLVFNACPTDRAGG
jgi:hypothetical protein